MLKMIQKILIVDDKEENLFALESILKDKNVDILKATNGNDALVQVLNNDIALAILDVQMPDMDGYELAAFVRGDRKNEHLPIIFLSAVYSDDYHIFKGYESGAVDFITKPFNPKVLLSKIDIFLELDLFKQTLLQKIELEKSKQHLERIIMSLVDPVVVVNQQGEITSINKRFMEITQYEKQEILYNNINAVFQDAAVIQWFKQGYQEQDYQLIKETNLIAKNGKKTPVLVSGTYLRNNQGTITGAVFLAKDLSDLKIAEHTIELSEERYRTLVETTVDGIILADNEAMIHSWNYGAQNIFGYTSTEIVGKPIQNVIPLTSLDEAINNKSIKTIKNQPEGRTFETIGLCKDGSEIPIEISLAVLELFSENYYTAIIRDISERKNQERERQLALEKAQQAEKIKSLFIANMSHEIRTPLNSLVGFINIIRERVEKDLDPETVGFFDIVTTSGDRLMKMVKGVLDISLIESGTYDIKLEKTDIALCVYEAVSYFKQEADKKGLEIIVEIDSDEPTAYCDLDSITQVIISLLENAVKYTDEGNIKIQLINQDDTLKLKISDTGIGISKEYQKHMYEPFTQESEGYTKKYQGAGIGLTLVKKYIELNKLSLEVESNQNKGSVFTLVFPKTENTTVKQKIKILKPRIPIIHQSGKTRGLHLLVVEDDINNQNLVKNFLNGQGDLHFSKSVNDAKAILMQQRIDMILLDLSLEGNSDGLELARYVRSENRFKNLPVIATTAHAFASDKEKCLANGCNAFLPKPLSKLTLINTIHKFIAKG